MRWELKKNLKEVEIEYFFPFIFWEEEEENFDEIRNPPLKDVEEQYFFLFFWQEEEEEKIIKNKEPPIKEVEEEYFLKIFFFLTGRKRKFNENNWPPSKKYKKIIADRRDRLRIVGTDSGL